MMSTDLKTSSISIVIPARNESENIGRLLSGLAGVPGIQVLVVDGASTDSTAATAESLGALVLTSSPSRALQMNKGAEAADGDILLFLHGDTRLEPGFADEIHKIMNQRGVSAGAFTLKINGKKRALRVIEWLVRLRSRFLQMPYGDQAIFLAAETFHSVGGFPDQPIMEDFELMRKLKRKGRIHISGLCTTTSARRWKRLGVLKTTLLNQLIIVSYLLGVSPKRLAGWYGKENRGG